jgi:ABC-type lipoprotein release transport system permease subunit
MAITTFFKIAFRDLIRNSRRTVLTALAIGLGLVVNMALASMIEGAVTNMIRDNIRLSTGHLQIQDSDYDVDEGSLLSRDLIKGGEALVLQAESMAEVQSAAPVLWVGGLLSTSQESTGIQVVGIDPDDAFHDPIREGISDGEYLKSDDRKRILVGRLLAEDMGITVGRRVSLAISDANGVGQEGIFTVAGLVDTGFPSVDQHRVILPLAQTQAFSGVGDRVSSIIILLHEQEDATSVAPKLQGPDYKIETWEDLNSLIIQSMEYGIYFYYIIYAIVFAVVAALIVNTLLMSVFARTREIGVLAALGMNQGQITLLFLLEGFIQALFGIALGLGLGLGAVAYMVNVGISIPEETATLIEGMAFGTTMYGGYAPGQFAALALLQLVIVLLVSIYPARFAAKIEPVEALRSGK